ncbi:MAG: NADH-quinone oxidoreductase subunit NuoH [Desulfovibrio sp.]|jgi:NADH-quinone oxidoreductase subunit H|nr:NADH-quinone oxidoreductase subunit NuoH [Desulfovibrio sp.]
MSLDTPLLSLLLGLAAILAFAGANGIVLVWVERKVAGRCQRRPGPLHVGPYGLLQPLADALKLISKQLITPRRSDRLLYWGAPLLSFMPVPICFLPLPFLPEMATVRLNLGLILILSFIGLNSISLCLAGLGSNNKWSLLGAARAIAQTVSFEIPLLLAALTAVFMAGSMDLHEVMAAQGPWPWQWFGFMNPLALLLFLISAVAETNRAPFDLPEAESELTAGFHTEYSGMGFGIFFLAEYAYILIICGVAAALFLGGQQGPVAPGPWWFLAKMYALVLLVIQLRWTLPRVRFDQLLNLCWRWMTPAALLNILATMLVMLALKGA